MERKGGRERERLTCYLLVYSPAGCNSHGLSWRQIFPCFLYEWQGPVKHSRLHSLYIGSVVSICLRFDAQVGPLLQCLLATRQVEPPLETTWTLVRVVRTEITALMSTYASWC